MEIPPRYSQYIISAWLSFSFLFYFTTLRVSPINICTKEEEVEAEEMKLV